MPRGCLMIGAFVIAFILGYVLAFATYLAIVELADFHDFEGAWTMAMAFQVGPAVGVLCGIAASWWAATRKRGGGS